jgi:hypothetical protein
MRFYPELGNALDRVPPPHRSYALQIGIADSVAVGLIGVAGVVGISCAANDFAHLSDNRPPSCPPLIPLLSLGVGTFALASPVIHLSHERPLAALAAFGLRAVAPSLTLWMFDALGRKSLVGVGSVALLAELATAVVVDLTVLAELPAERQPSNALALQPTLVISEREAGIALNAHF